MTDRPILFSAPMVRAILDGRKTQTRRVVKAPWKGRQIINLRSFYNDNGYTWSGDFNDPHSWGVPNFIDQDPLSVHDMSCKYGSPGDRIWVRETFCRCVETGGWLYRATETAHVVLDDGDGGSSHNKDGSERSPWKPSIHMPRDASRITLEITNVRVERLQYISDADALAEGVDQTNTSIGGYATERFKRLWQTINGPESWAANPWVWVIEFKRVIP